MSIALDFDRVIHDLDHPRPGRKMGGPMPGCTLGMERLAMAGHEIIVYTTRARTEPGRMAVVDWLDFFALPYSEVTALKPKADVYIDDLGYRFIDWPTTMLDLTTGFEAR